MADAQWAPRPLDSSKARSWSGAFLHKFRDQYAHAREGVQKPPRPTGQIARQAPATMGLGE